MALAKPWGLANQKLHVFAHFTSDITAMDTTKRNCHVIFKSYIQRALKDIKSKRYSSIWACSIAKGIPRTTLHFRISGQLSRAQAHERRRILPEADAKLLYNDSHN